MAEAQKINGVAVVAYVDGKAVDSEGREVKGAPTQPEDTDPSEQPHAMAGLNTEERSAAILAQALAKAMGKAAAPDEDGEGKGKSGKRSSQKGE